MKLGNHIAYRFLTDETLAYEIIQTMHPKEWKDFVDHVNTDDPHISPEVASMIQLVGIRHCDKAYYITETVLDKLDLLKVKKQPSNKGVEHYDYTVFSNLSDRKVTFVLPENRLLRMRISGEVISFCWLYYIPDKTEKDFGTSHWVLFYINRVTGQVCDHFEHQDVQSIEELVYKMLCFMYLSENEEIIVEPGRKYGTKKSGKLINSLNIPLVIVNSRWNITSIRTEGFTVSGHFALRRVGSGRTSTRMVWIDPFEKHGYVREAKNLNEKNTTT